MGGNSGGATSGGRIRKSGSRIGRVDTTRQSTLVMGREFISFISPLGKGDGLPNLSAHTTRDGSLKVGWSDAGLHKGQGYGMGMYIAAMKEAKRRGIGFRSDRIGQVSEDAQRVWDRLAARGVAVRENKTGRGDTPMFEISASELNSWGRSGRDWTSLESGPRIKKAAG